MAPRPPPRSAHRRQGPSHGRLGGDAWATASGSATPGGVSEHLLYLRAGVERGVWIVYRISVGDGGYLFHKGAVALLRVPNLLLCPLALTYVLDLGDEVQRLAFFVVHHRDAQEGPHYVALLVEVALLHLVGAYLPDQHPAHLVEIRIEVVGVGYVLEGLLKQYFFSVAEYLAQGSVRLKEAPVCPHQRHPDGCVLEGPPEPLLCFPKRLFCPLALGDVPSLHHHALHVRVVEEVGAR